MAKVQNTQKISVKKKTSEWFLEEPLESYSWKSDGVYVDPNLSLIHI